MTASVDWPTSVITVPFSDLTSIGGNRYSYDVMAKLHLDLRTLHASEDGGVYPKTHSHKQNTLLAGVDYADIVEVLPPYTIEFEDGQRQVVLTGANHNVSDVQVVNQVGLLTQNSAGLINATLTQPQIRDAVVPEVIAAVEYQRGAHTAEVYLYVDGANGSDTNDGSESAPKKTIGSALAAVLQEHTAIILRGGGSGQQVYTENITLSIPFTFLRGPGLDVRIAPASDASPTITLAAKGCSVEGCEVVGAATGTADAIVTTTGTDFCRFFRIRVLNARRHGINCVDGDRHECEKILVEGSGQSGSGVGVRHSNVSFSSFLGGCKITGSADDNILIEPNGGAAVDNAIDSAIVTNAGAFGIRIAAGAERTSVTDVSFSANTSGDISDLGTDTSRHGTDLETYDRIYIDPDPANGTAGRSFPLGTRAKPVSNFIDAFVIADGAGRNEFVLLGDVAMPVGGRQDATFIGEGGEIELDINGENVDGSTLRRLDIAGDAAGSDLVAEDCFIDGVTNFKGRAFRCRLGGTLGLNAGFSDFVACVSADPLIPLVLDFGVATARAELHTFDGDIVVDKVTANNSCVIGLVGDVIVNVSCIAGTIRIRGIGKLTNNTGGTVVDAKEYLPKALFDQHSAILGNVV